MPDETVLFWEAYWKHEPWSGNWEQHAQLCSVIDTIRVGLSSGDPNDLREFKDWMPDDWVAPERPQQDVNDQLKGVSMFYPKAE